MFIFLTYLCPVGYAESPYFFTDSGVNLFLTEPLGYIPVIDTEKLKDMKVLIVDDVSDNLKVLYNALRNDGYELSLAKTGKQALKHIRQHLPDLILLDIVLPDMNGYEICKLLKKDDAVKDIPVIFLSAKMDSKDIIKGFHLGAVDYITKPFAHAEVVARVKNHLTLKCLHEDLEHRVQQRTEELLKAKNLAEAASQAKSTFLSRMNHELRTPLNAIMGFAQLLQNSMPKDTADRHKVMPERILEAGGHLLMLINDILDIVNSEKGEMDMPLAACSLDQIVKESFNFVKIQAGDKGVTITTYRPSMLYVHANPSRLKQAIVNLLSNAIKYNHRGGTVTLSVVSVADHEVEISVQDTGLGIPTKDQEVIFEPFHRLASAEAKEIEGTGIGLAITKLLVKKMHGSVRVDSKAGRGSTFSITLPKATPAIPFPSQKQSAQGELRQAFCHTVLYIDDAPDKHEMLRMIFSTRNTINFLTARTAEEGINIAEQTRPNLIFLDINLPQENGNATAKLIKANALLSQTRLIALGADAVPGKIDLAMEAGFDQYLTKPVAFKQIIKIIDAL